MNKSIFITNGQQAFNQMIATRMLSIGHRVVLHIEGSEQGIAYARSLESDAAQRLHIVNGMPAEEAEYAAMMEEAVSVMGELDVMIHGNEMLDEESMFEEGPDEFGEQIPALFERIFLWNKSAVSHMIKRKSGKIVFPIIYDTLYYDEYPSSPIMNHGKISMMKCLSRECSAFRIDVNVMTFGYHDADFEKSEKKEKQRKLEIYGLKPVMKPMSEMLAMLDFIIHAPNSLIGGQNFEIGIGVETNL
ncbi:SDR family NAD(P)-dependent oxidoreductase [Paenibacillus sp. P36]|uniref:SDR family NAD(P)-dependent oxidoreductase n=1 Tax=Paenibacillus sp. P36 TaxID=3342538 RepID=UPI0038B336CE